MEPRQHPTAGPTPAAAAPWHEWFDIRASEIALVARLFALAALAGLAVVYATTAGSTLFLARFGAAWLPWVYVGNAVVLSALAAGLAPVQRRLAGSRLAALAPSLLAFGTVGIWGLALTFGRPVYPALLVWVEIVSVYTGLHLWSVVGRSLDVRQGKRLYGVVGAGVIAGELVGGFSIAPVVRSLPVEHLLPVAAVLLAAGQALGLRIRAAAPTVDPDSSSDVHADSTVPGLLRSGYVRRIIALVACSVLVWFFIDLHFLRAVERRFDERDLAVFLGVFSGTVAVANLGVQLLLTGRVLQSGGILAGLLTLPVALALPVALLWGVGVHWAFALLVTVKLVDEVLRSTIHDASTQLLYQALPGFQRDATHRLVNGLVEPLVGGIAGVALILLDHSLHAGGAQDVGWLALLLVPWMAAGVLLRRDYRQTLLRSLGSRLVEPGLLDLRDPAARTLVERGLQSDDDLQVQASLSLLGQHAIAIDDARLRLLLNRPGRDVRIAALVWIRDHGARTLLADVEPLLQDPVRAVQLQAIRSYCAVDPGDTLQQMAPFLRHDDLDVQVAAAAGVIEALGVDGVVAMAPQLKAWAESPQPVLRAALARLLGEIAIEKFYRPLLPLLSDGDVTVRRAALAAAARVRNPALVPAMCKAMANLETQAVAVQSLLRWGPDVALLLQHHLQAAHPVDEVRGALKVLGRSRHPGALAIIAQFVSLPNEMLRTEGLEQLVQGRRGGPSPLPPQVIDRLLTEEVDDARRTLAWLGTMPAGEPALVMVRALERELAMNQHRLLLLLALRYEPQAIDRAAWLHRKGTGAQRALALEVLDNTLNRADAGLVLPALDLQHKGDGIAAATRQLEAATRRSSKRPPQDGAQGTETRTETQANVTPDFAAALTAVLDPTLPMVRDWTRLAALFTIGRLELDAIRPAAVPWLTHESEVVRETAALAAHGGRKMLLTVEKVLFLKGTDMFTGIHEEDLVAVAEIARARGVPAESPVFAQGDLGDALYVIVRGQVRIHIGDRTLVTLSERQHFGELAVLDPQPRSASATAADDCLLLEIARPHFKELLERSPEVAHGVIVYLVNKVRVLTPR